VHPVVKTQHNISGNVMTTVRVRKTTDEYIHPF